ncbi:MAG: heme-binding domain-containing protein [Bacteroidia bacterium]|nr:heme-binding domain-containing protein [Bacteroidia bacterium]
MKKRFTFKKIVLVLGILLLLIQSIRIDKTTQPVDINKDFISLVVPNQEVSAILKSSCYDCHSNQPIYPWYSNVAPVSWWIKNHINEGSHHLNFSVWGDYSDKRKHHKLEECIEMVEEDEMPMSSYTFMHKNAVLTDAQKLQLVEFFKALKNEVGTKENLN